MCHAATLLLQLTVFLCECENLDLFYLAFEADPSSSSDLFLCVERGRAIKLRRVEKRTLVTLLAPSVFEVTTMTKMPMKIVCKHFFCA